MEVQYTGRDNETDLQLTSKRQAIELVGITKFELNLTKSGSTNTAKNSTDNPTVFTVQPDGKTLRIILGHQNLDLGTWRAVLITYDADNPAGIVWGSFQIEIKIE